VSAAFLLLAPAAKAEEDVWPKLKQQTFGDRQIQAEDGTVVLEIPGTAEDAALVPLTVRVPPAVRDRSSNRWHSLSTRTLTRWWRP
jgi:sulfur-oxidizing protein SoxY